MDDITSFAPPSRTGDVAELERLADDELMAVLKTGRNDALSVLFDRYHRLVFSIALKIVRDRGDGGARENSSPGQASRTTGAA